MRNPYFCDEPTVISFSGGRTSAFMLHKVLDAHDGVLPDFVKVVFANTGKEMPQTLEFVEDCSNNWNVDIVWLERFLLSEEESLAKSGKKYSYETKIVNYKTASRNGEPFESLSHRPMLPNPVARFCTVELKIRAISEYLVNTCGFEKPYVGYIGIRYDEQTRAVKMNRTIESGQERRLPLFEDKITKKDIYRFWINQPFDLQLPNNNGTTDWGNCDLCFLKGANKRLSMIKARPELADWWIKMESKFDTKKGQGALFRRDTPSYQQLKIIATDQNSFDFGTDELSIPCFCGD